MSQHTPGPWTVEDSGNGYDIVGPDTVLIADAYPDSVEDYAIPTGDALTANARLIAAAPEMLQALAELVAEADEHPGWEGHPHRHTAGFEMARTVLAKIETQP